MTAVLVAHTVAGGALPSAWWLVLTAAGVYAGSLAVLSGRVRMRTAVPALVAAQLLLHGWLVALAGPGAHGHGDHLGAGEPGILAAFGAEWAMLLAHLAGAAATAWVWALRRRAVDLVVAWAGLVRPDPPPGREACRTPAPRGLCSRLAAIGTGARGPPALAAPART